MGAEGARSWREECEAVEAESRGAGLLQDRRMAVTMATQSLWERV
jgi:hypothetical protein